MDEVDKKTISAVTTILLSSTNPHLNKLLNPFTKHLTPSTVKTIISSPILSSKPKSLLSFYLWSCSNLPPFISNPNLTLPSLLSLLPILLHHFMFSSTSSLLLSFINSNPSLSLSLHTSILSLPLAPRPLRRFSALLDSAVSAYARSGRPNLALSVFYKMHSISVPPTLATFHSLLLSLLRSPAKVASPPVSSVFSAALRLGLRPTTTTFNILLMSSSAVRLPAADSVSFNTILGRICNSDGGLSDARPLLVSMTSARLPPTHVTYNTLLAAYCRLGRLPDAAVVLSSMESARLPPDAYTHNTLLAGLCRLDRLDEALRFRCEIPAPDVVTYNILIGCCLRLGRRRDAGQLLDEMLEVGVRMNGVTCNIMVRCLCEEGGMAAAVEFVEKMEVSPDYFTFNTLIHGFCRVRNMSGALQTMDLMKVKGFMPDTFTFNTVLHGLCREDEAEKAEGLLRRSKELGYESDSVSYGTVMTAYFNGGKKEKALGLWEEMKGEGVNPSVATYNTIICGLCRAGEVEAAVRKMREMAENGLTPDRTTYNTLIHGFCTARNVERAFEFYNTVVKSSFFTPDVYTSNILLSGLCREELLDKALRFFDTLVSKNRDIDTVSYNILMSTLCSKGRVARACSLLVHMETRGLRPDTYTYNAFVKAFEKAGVLSNGCEKSADSEDYDGSEPFSKSASEQVEELCRRGEFEKAMRVFSILYRDGVRLSKSAVLTLIDRILKYHKPNYFSRSSS